MWKQKWPILSPPPLILSIDDEIGNRKQRRGAVAERSQATLGPVDELPRVPLALLEAQQLHVCRLVRCLVLPCGLTQVLRARRDVEYVVRHLEREPDVHREPLARLDLLGGGPAQDGPRGHRHLQERRGLVNVYPLEVVEGGAGLALALEVHDLPPREALGTDGPAQSGDDLDDALGRYALGVTGHVLEGRA